MGHDAGRARGGSSRGRSVLRRAGACARRGRRDRGGGDRRAGLDVHRARRGRGLPLRRRQRPRPCASGQSGPG